MKLKPIVGGIIIAASFAVVGISQAACYTNHCRMQQEEFTGLEQVFTGTGWHMVRCNMPLRRAESWAQYTSGSYAPPVTPVVRVR